MLNESLSEVLIRIIPTLVQLGTISGFYTHHFEEDTYSKSENVQILKAGGDSLGGNINAAIYSALEDDPRHFIADEQVMVEVKRGISFSAVFLKA